MEKLQKFKCHKVVEAMKIAEVEVKETGGAVLYGELGSEIHVAPSYVEKHEPKAGGYYVRYDNGYESWSPADAFEAGYTLEDGVHRTPAPCCSPQKPCPTHSGAPTHYPVSEKVAAELANRFTYHPPKGDQQERYVALRDDLRRFATLIVMLTPQSREQSVALTKLDEVGFWANASIARNE